MVVFIVEAKSKDCPWVPSVPFLSLPLCKKSSLAFIRPRTKAKGQRFSAIGLVCIKA